MRSPADFEAASCQNCGAALTGPFCAQCGQSADTHRFTWGHLLHEVPHSLWHVDRGLPYTLKEMLLRPGHTMRRYLAGQRVDLFRPLALVLIMASVASFLVLALHIQRVQPVGGTFDPGLAAANQAVLKYLPWIQVATLPGYALLSRALLRRLKYNIAEHLVGLALVVGTVLFVQALFFPLLALTGSGQWATPVAVFTTLMAPVYVAWAITQFARGAYGWAGSIWRGALVATVGFILGGLLQTGLGFLIVRLSH